MGSAGGVQGGWFTQNSGPRLASTYVRHKRSQAQGHLRRGSDRVPWMFRPAHGRAPLSGLRSIERPARPGLPARPAQPTRCSTGSISLPVNNPAAPGSPGPPTVSRSSHPPCVRARTGHAASGHVAPEAAPGPMRGAERAAPAPRCSLRVKPWRTSGAHPRDDHHDARPGQRSVRPAR